MATHPADRYEARVAAPSRLHFGLLSLGSSQGRRYGALGAMIDRPGLRLTLQGADHFEVRGPLADRAAEFARRLFQALGHPGDPPCRIQIESAPPEHVGLGTGTQLGLAVASALHPLLMTQPALRGGEFLGESRVALASGEVAVADDRDFASPEARLQSRPPNTATHTPQIALGLQGRPALLCKEADWPRLILSLTTLMLTCS